MADLNIYINQGTPVQGEGIGVNEDLGGSLVQNSSFENAPSFTAATTSSSKFIDGTAGGSSTNDTWRWAISSGSGSFAAQFDSSTSNTGINSLKVSTTATNSTVTSSQIPGGVNLQYMSQYGVPVLPSTSYTCSVWVKTTVNSGSATTGAQVNFALMNGASLGSNHFTTSITTTTNWTKYTLTFSTGSSTTQMWPQLIVKGNDGSATLVMDAWFDDVQIQTTTSRHTGVFSDLDPQVTPGIQQISGPKIWP